MILFLYSRVKNFMQCFVLVFLAMALSACGTTTSVKLAIKTPDKTSFIFRDERLPEQKISRTDNSSLGATMIYGDDKLSPSVTEMLRAKLHERLSTQLEGKTVFLAKFYVRVFEPTASVDFNRLNTAAASVPGGYAAAPLAGLLILGIENIKSEKIVSIDIEGTVDNTKFTTSVSDSYRGRVTEENMRTSLQHALEQFTTELQQIGAGKLKNGNKEVAAQEMSDDQKSELENLGSIDCSASSAQKVSVETYFRHGKALIASNEYKPAMACFLRAQEGEKDSYAYRESCSQIATMYELGWGVDKDTETAKIWLKKSGL